MALRLTSFGLSKTVIKELSKLRISAPDLIEKGRYFRPVIPRNQRVCLNCEQVEDKIHFMLFCSESKDLRILLFQRLNIHTHDLRPNTVEAFSMFPKLLNPTNEKETKIYDTILPMH